MFHFLDTFEKESVSLKVSEFEANEEKKELEKTLQEVSRGARSAEREGGREEEKARGEGGEGGEGRRKGDEKEERLDPGGSATVLSSG